MSTAPSPLPQRLRDPPAYTAIPSTHATTAAFSATPPPYPSIASAAFLTRSAPKTPAVEKNGAEGQLHFLDHDQDTVASLSLRYGVPASVLQRTNNITSDHLLLAKRVILIPGQFGTSFSPRPVEGEAEEVRKSKIRRFMTFCKVFDYDIALTYLEQSEYDLGAAIESYLNDDDWEKNHPRQSVEDVKAGRERQRHGSRYRGL